jgi:MFS family permease
MTSATESLKQTPVRTKLNRSQILGFWAAWSGWTLDGMDSVIYALVLSPALTELLPRSGIKATPGNVGFAGSVLFGFFLVGWGLSIVWGPIADRFGRTRVLAATIFVYAIFTGATALSQNVWQLAIFRLLAGIGIGGEWALAGTYVAESWPEDRRKMGAGYLQTGYYAGFFLAAALNYTVGVHYGWRAMFWCGLSPVVIAFLVLHRVKEPERWQRTNHAVAHRKAPLRVILSAPYTRRTIVNTILLIAAVCGLWSGSVYVPTAIVALATRAGMKPVQTVHWSSFGTGVLSIGTILGCLALPLLAERMGRKLTMALYFIGMAVFILLSFGWAFYLAEGLRPFIILLFFLGFFGGNFTMFSLWVPEQYETSVRATAFAFTTSFGRFFAAGVNFAIGALIGRMGTLGKPVAITAIGFVIGLLAIPFGMETKGQRLPD